MRLVDGAGLDFPDLTGYNVMIDGERMWLVDFGRNSAWSISGDISFGNGNDFLCDSGFGFA